MSSEAAVRDRVLELINQKIEGQDITAAPEEAPAAQIIDLMSALKASLEKVEPGTTLCLANNWLDATAGDSVQMSQGEYTANYSGNGYWCGGYWYPWATYYVNTYQPQPKIRLTLSEVERLRKLAKADAKVKETLQKFTGFIEIVVDF